MRLHNWFRQFWGWLRRAPKPDFTIERVATHPAPDRIKSGKIVVVGDRQIQKWACFQCPGGCKEVIKLSLNHMTANAIFGLGQVKLNGAVIPAELLRSNSSKLHG
jgi:hypothetical protein